LEPEQNLLGIAIKPGRLPEKIIRDAGVDAWYANISGLHQPDNEPGGVSSYLKPGPGGCSGILEVKTGSFS
jgi:hypothetical protein